MKLEKLGNIATIKTGKYDVNHSTPDGEYVFYTCAFGQFKSPTYSFEGPAIILPGNGANVGEVFFYDGKFEAYQRTYVVQNFKADPSYIYTYFKAKWKNSLRNKQFGSATNYIRLNNLTDFIIPVPPLADQLHIAKLLSKAENLISQRKESITVLDEFLKSTFTELFGNVTNNEKGFEKMNFAKVALNENSKRIPVRQSDRDAREGIYPYYGATGIIDTIDDYKFDGDYLLIAEDGKNLLFRKKNNAFMATGRFWVNNHAHVLSFNGVCNLKYLEYFLNSIDFRPYITGIDQVKLNKENLDRIPVPVPPVQLQTRFAQIVEKTETLKTQYQQSLQELENLYGSLSQRAFKGELTLRQEERFLLAAEPDINKRISVFDLKISSIARGISVGGDLEYTDEITLGRSITGRTLF